MLGICPDCKETKHIYKPQILSLSTEGTETRWTLDLCPARCSDCLKKLGLSFGMIVIPINEGENLLGALETAVAGMPRKLALRWNYMADHGGLDPNTFEPMKKVDVPV